MKRKTGFIGERLRLALTTRTMSMMDLSVAAKLPYSSVQNYVSDVQSPGAEGLLKIRSATGININWLLTGDGEMYSEEERLPRRKMELRDLQELRARFSNFDEVLELKDIFSFEDVKKALPQLELAAAIGQLAVFRLTFPESYRQVAGDRSPEDYTPAEALEILNKIMALQMETGNYK